ncbi:MAG: carboxylesterase family protein [Pseudomonadales bacterium]|nr:carboxylesterase family protein [Pseudomonadales bacterium]
MSTNTPTSKASFESATPASASYGPGPTTETLYGELQGAMVTEEIAVFRGIPYAAAPVAEKRWKAPQAPETWRDVRDATAFSDSCIQPTFTSNYVWRRADFAVSEDCLYLNIWAKQNTDNLPVMVWFHGGAHTSGQGHSKIFDGTTLAEHDVVLVSINYRLGALGFLAHPWLSEESAHDSSGNYGLSDKISALNWVRDNIAQFGGNPDNITIFGQSAGSQSVCSLMASPLAQGLFHKAIGQSAACVGPAPQRDPAGLERGEKLVDLLGATSLETLRNVPPEDILNATEASGWTNDSRIVIDGWVLPEAQIETFRAGRQSPVPLMLGCLADEGVNLFPVNADLTDDQLAEYLSRTLGDQATAIKAAYAAEHKQSPGTAQHAIATDLFMAFAMRRWAEYQVAVDQPTYLYFMDHIPPAFHLYMPEDPKLETPEGPRHAAYHSGDLAYVFGNVDKVGLDWTPEDRALSDLMVNYWTNFARTGDPNGDALPDWQSFNSQSFATQRLNAETQTVDGIRRDRLDLIAEAFPR